MKEESKAPFIGGTIAGIAIGLWLAMIFPTWLMIFFVVLILIMSHEH